MLMVRHSYHSDFLLLSLKGQRTLHYLVTPGRFPDRSPPIVDVWSGFPNIRLTLTQCNLDFHFCFGVLFIGNILFLCDHIGFKLPSAESQACITILKPSIFLLVDTLNLTMWIPNATKLEFASYSTYLTPKPSTYWQHILSLAFIAWQDFSFKLR